MPMIGPALLGLVDRIPVADRFPLLHGPQVDQPLIVSVEEFANSGGWSSAASGTGAVTVSQSDRAGVVNLATGTTANSFAQVFPAGQITMINPAASVWWAFARMMCLGGRDNVTQQVFHTSHNGPTVPQFDIGFIGSISTTQWSWRVFDDVAALKASGSAGVADVNVWHDFEIACDGQTLYFAVDGALIGKAPVPSTATLAMFWSFVIGNGATVLNRSMQADRAGVIVVGN